MNILNRYANMTKAFELIGNGNLKLSTGSIEDAKLALHMIDLWKKNGSKTFVISKELVEAFSYTDIPLDLSFEDFCLPFDHFLIEGEIPFFEVDVKIGNTKAGVDSILYGKNNGFNYLGGLYPCNIGHGEIIESKLLESEKGFDNLYIKINEGNFKELLNDKNRTSSLNPIDKSELQKLVNIFFNTILYLGDPSRDKNETEETRSRKIKNDSKSVRQSNNFIYVKPPKNYRFINQSHCSGYKIDKRFVVRGHWRKQHFGPKNSMQKLKKIAPFWKGPTISEVVSKIYKLN